VSLLQNLCRNFDLSNRGTIVQVLAFGCCGASYGMCPSFTSLQFLKIREPRLEFLASSHGTQRVVWMQQWNFRNLRIQRE
jgi:hypothetical protein